MARLDLDDDGDLSRSEIFSVIGLAAVFIISAGYIALWLVGLL